MASADFCLMTSNVAIQCAFVSALGFGGNSILFRMGLSPMPFPLPAGDFGVEPVEKVLEQPFNS